jgi:outer membrane protein OmpA-like peptidoglycan-associated protein
MSPFLASDGVTLYFASDRFGGFGSNDIWFSTRLDDSWTKWSKPVNMGANINTEEFEAYYSIDAEGEYAYMVSYNNTYGQGDIVRVKLLENQKPRPVTLISGKVIDAKTRKPLAANVRYEVLPKGNLSGNASSNPSNGAYKLVLPSGHKYGFLASAEGYLPVSENIDLTEQIKYSEIQRDLELVPIESGETIRLNNIFFETGKYDLSPESFPELDRLALVFASNPNFAIEVEGHTDNVGNDKKNTELSLQRAKSVKNYLQSKGVKEDKINAKGYGKTKPVAENDSDENRQKNRRVEFKILSK